MADSQDFGVSA